MLKITEMEDYLKGYVGPLAHFVIKKQMDVMGLSNDVNDMEVLKKLIDEVVKKSIFDPKLQHEAMMFLKNKAAA